MKLIFFNIFILITLTISAQQSEFPVTNKSEFTSYITKQNDTIRVGDKIELGTPAAPTQFTYITQNSYNVSPDLTGDVIEVLKLKSKGNKKRGYKMYAYFKGYGIAYVVISIEAAIKTGEVIIKR